MRKVYDVTIFSQFRWKTCVQEVGFRIQMSEKSMVHARVPDILVPAISSMQAIKHFDLKDRKVLVEMVKGT